MSETSKPEPELKVVSLPPEVVVINKIDPEVEEPVMLYPFLMSKDQVIEDISELIDKVYEEFSKACEKRNLNWEAELELGMEFGVKFTAKLKISPKS